MLLKNFQNFNIKKFVLNIGSLNKYGKIYAYVEIFYLLVANFNNLINQW